MPLNAPKCSIFHGRLSHLGHRGLMHITYSTLDNILHESRRIITPLLSQQRLL